MHNMTLTRRHGKSAARAPLWFIVYCSLSSVHAAPLNDTGITWGGNFPSGNNADCTGETIAAQDCSYGRDAAAAAGTLQKIGGGAAGFDFTKLDAAGNALPASATFWSCVKDNVTGLVWEVKTNDGGLRDADWTYTWYNTDSATNGGAAGTANGGSCSGSACDTQGFVQAVNAQALCGANDWRVPDLNELQSIAHLGKTNPAIDTEYFPHTRGTWYWSGSPSAPFSDGAWSVYFYHGGNYGYPRGDNIHVRLVRGGQ